MARPSSAITSNYKVKKTVDINISQLDSNSLNRGFFNTSNTSNTSDRKVLSQIGHLKDLIKAKNYQGGAAKRLVRKPSKKAQNDFSYPSASSVN